MPRARRRIAVGAVAGLAVLMASACRSTTPGRPPSSTSGATTVVTQTRATSFDGLPQVGALFAGTSDTGPHFCTASVVHSTHGDIIATAAHCVTGTGSGLLFAPGYHAGVAPDGLWSVTAAYVDARWASQHDPHADYAFLTVAPQTRDGHRVQIEQVVGADRLAIDQPTTTAVTVAGYPAQVGGRPIICSTTTYAHQGYVGFDCGGFVDGTSGSPWLVDYRASTRRGRLSGVIGGLHQGGCSPDTSYTARFDSATAHLLTRAEQGGPGDDVSAAGGDGC